jgi:hypothetical protein
VRIHLPPEHEDKTEGGIVSLEQHAELATIGDLKETIERLTGENA